jgi:hypothetical protein
MGSQGWLAAATIIPIALLIGIAFLVRASPQLASPESVSVPLLVSFQGRVQVNGSPYNGVGYFKFAVVNASGNATYWSNDNTSLSGTEPSGLVPLSVNGGLFTVLLGDSSQGGMSSALSAAVFSGPEAAGVVLQHWFDWFIRTTCTG